MVRFGCLGAARITPAALILPVAANKGAQVSAIAARNGQRAADFATEHGIPGVETDYAALVKRVDVDAVYNALPPSAHAELTIMALEAGKAVLCEKPMAMNAEEAARMAQAAACTGGLLMEAFHYRFHPAFSQALEIAREGDLGRLISYAGHFSVEIPERDGQLRHELALGGGAMMDLGCYPLHWARTLLGSEPEVLSAMAVMGREGIDLSMTADMVFDGGVKASITASMVPGVKRSNWFKLIGTDAALHFDNPLAPHLGYRVTLHPKDADEPIIVAEEGPGKITTYDYQLAHFLKCLAGEAEPLLPPADGVANMQAIDTIYRAAGMVPRGMSD